MVSAVHGQTPSGTTVSLYPDGTLRIAHPGLPTVGLGPDVVRVIKAMIEPKWAEIELK